GCGRCPRASAPRALSWGAPRAGHRSRPCRTRYRIRPCWYRSAGPMLPHFPDSHARLGRPYAGLDLTTEQIVEKIRAAPLEWLGEEWSPEMTVAHPYGNSRLLVWPLTEMLEWLNL